MVVHAEDNQSEEVYPGDNQSEEGRAVFVSNVMNKEGRYQKWTIQSEHKK